MNDFQLQTYFEGKEFTINGATRECYYCTLEDGGAWIWLHTNKEDREDNYKRINFVVYSGHKIEELYKKVLNKADIELTDYGQLSKQR